MAKKDETKLISVEIFCGKLNKKVKVGTDKVTFYGTESECEMCGTHGNTGVSVACECGKTHDIELSSW